MSQPEPASHAPEGRDSHPGRLGLIAALLVAPVFVAASFIVVPQDEAEATHQTAVSSNVQISVGGSI